MGSKPSSDIDRLIGHQIRWLRRDRKLAATELAAGIGMKITLYQQSEEGTRRLRSPELVEIAKFLNVSIEALFPKTEDVSDPYDKRSRRIDPAAVQPSAVEVHDLLHYFSGIDDPCMRQHMLDLLRRASHFNQ